jgi:hypothetical protein
MDNLVKALESGKRRGYKEVRQHEAVRYLFQYAIKKDEGLYVTYYFKIDESKFDVYEDYGVEEVSYFLTLNEALCYLNDIGADIAKFSAIKRMLPF